MKVFLLAVLIIMLFYSVKHTPTSLSKKRHDSMIKTDIKRLKKKKESMSDDEWNIAKLITIIMTLILYDLFALIYILVWVELDNKYIFVLSSLQIVTVLCHIKEFLCVKDVLSLNIEDYKFHRFWRLFNTILDYIYYPAAIAMLLM